jgi:dynein regulatory complex protein 1
VLQKRDKENTETISQQKRKIARSLDTVNQLKLKLTKQEKAFQEDNEDLTEVFCCYCYNW